MKIVKLLFLAGFVLVLNSCKKYLEEEPKKQTTIKTVDQLVALIDNATAFTYDGTNPTASHSTDDTEIPLDAYKKNPNRWTLEPLLHYVFETQQVADLGTDALWSGEFRKIFIANIVLTNLDKVEGDANVKSALKADAHFIRAYSYWNLVQYYCLPYGPAKNENEPGLPLKTTTDYEEPLNRATLQETYAFIEADIMEALKTTQDDVDPTKPWRVSKKAVQAFMSRYYLFLGSYDKSMEQTNLALTSQNAKFVNFKTILPGVVATYTNPSATLNYSELNDWQGVKHIYWKEFYYPRFTYSSSQWWLPSPSLVALFDKTNDLRYKWLMIENGGRRFTVIDPPLIRYSVFFDGRYLCTGPTVAEMWLNKAEVLARKGDVPGAMLAVNTLRAQRFNTMVTLTATDQADAIKKVLEERRREMPFAFRWWDIRRFSINDYPADDVAVVRTFYKVGVGVVDVNATQTYSVPVGSKRYAVPINSAEVGASKGQITQNAY